MAYRGHVENGVVVLDDVTGFCDGMEVRVEPVAPDPMPTLTEQFHDVIGIVDDLPEDMAENHDHYIHGKPKE